MEILRIMMYTLVFALIGLGILCFVALLVVTVKEKYENDMAEQYKAVKRMNDNLTSEMAKLIERMEEIEHVTYKNARFVENALNRSEKRQE